jgi:N-acetylated-alpha-linked acidic dipeptidase
VEGSHTLEKFINGVARDIEDPEAKMSVWKRLQAERLAGPAGSSNPVMQQMQQDRAEVRGRADLRIGALGSGSDYTAFLDHLGIASMNVGFGGEDGGGIYHSIYDDFYWYTHFSDTTFVYGRALAQTVGTAVLRLADADLLPFDFDDFTDTMRRYVTEVENLARQRRDQILERNRAIDDGLFAATSDPKLKLVPPPKQPVPPFLNFAPLENGVAALQRTTEMFDKALTQASENGGAALARASLKEVNDRLVMLERVFLLGDGLPNRPWFQNQIYAPGFYTGYGVKTLPGVREAIEQSQWKLADEQIVRVGKVLDNAGEAIEGTANDLQRAVK